MAKTYRVGDTDYQFPDDFTDDQVQSVLAQQGVIKPKRRRDPLEPPRLKGTPKLPDDFAGTLVGDLGSIPEGAYTAVRHPWQSTVAAVDGLRGLPAEVVQDLKDGKFGKLSARALEFLVPALSASRLRGAAVSAGNRATAAAGRAATRIAESPIPESIGAELKATLTPGMVNRIKDRAEQIRASRSQAKSAAPAAAASGPSSPAPATKVIQHLRDRGPLPPATQAEQLARYLKSKSVTAESAAAMTDADWQLTAAAAGLPTPTPEIIQAARGQLSWRRAPSPRGKLKPPDPPEGPGA